jgi:hypothetical protein
MKSNVTSLLSKVASWQKMGQVSLASDSLASRINEAALTAEISYLDKRAMLEMQDELKLSVACLVMADAFNAARRIRASKRTADNASIIDTLLHGVDELTDVISKSGDENLVMIQKMLSDFLMELKVNGQKSSKEQEQYEHSDMEPANAR